MSIFIVNIVLSRAKRELSSDDPWDARTLEWTTTSPPPPENFPVIPVVHSVDEFWHRKYTEDEQGRLVKLTDEERRAVEAETEGQDHDAAHGLHLPSPSFYPILAAFGLPILAYGIIYGRSGGGSYIVSVIGGLITVGALYGWGFEPSVEPEILAEAAAEHGEPALVGGPRAAGELGSGSGGNGSGSGSDGSDGSEASS